MLALNPDLYWPLAEPAGAVTFAEVSGKHGPTLVYDNSKYGLGTAPTAGQALGVPGDPGGLGVKFTPAGDGSGLTQATTILGSGPILGNNSPPVQLPAAIGTGWALSAALWVNAVDNASLIGTQLLSLLSVGGSGLTGNLMLWSPMYIVATSTGAVNVKMSNDSASGSFNVSAVAARHVTDGKPHLIAATVQQSSNGDVTLWLYIDGVGFGPSNWVSANINGLLQRPASTVEVGGLDDTFSFMAVASGTVAHVAIWNRLLSASDVTALWNAGQGYAGETSGARISRYLAGVGYTGGASVDTGQSVMAAAAAEGANLLASAQAVAASENGNLVTDGTGTVTFTSRTRRYLTTTAKWAFGELELPYQEGISFDHDPQLVFNDVKVTNASGAAAAAADAASQATYGPAHSAVTSTWHQTMRLSTRPAGCCSRTRIRGNASRTSRSNRRPTRPCGPLHSGHRSATG